MAEFGNPLSAAFWAGAPADSPLSYQALQTRRKIAEQLMGKRSPFPKTFGEGLTYAGERFADVMYMNRLDAAEKQQAEYEDKRLRNLQPGSENTAVAPAGQPASRPVSDAGTDTTAPVQTAAAPGQPLDVTPSKFANVRYKNPGAQYPVSGENATAFGQQGAGTIGGGHKIAQFPTPVHGAAANMDLLDRNYTGTTIGDAINKWSGGGRRNVPGFNTDTVITKEMMRDPSFAIPFMQAVAGGEAPGRYPMNADQWAQAHNMFTGVRGGTPPPLPPSDPRGRITQAVIDQAEPTNAMPSASAVPYTNFTGLGATPPAPVRTAALTTPGVASDAGPASAIADGASTAVAALPVQAQPPTQTPPLIPGSGPPTVTTEVKPIPRPPVAQNVAGAAVPPPIAPYDPGPEPKREKPTPYMQNLEAFANDPRISPERRAAAQNKYNELFKVQHEDFTNKWTIWKPQQIKSQDPATSLDLQHKQLSNVELTRKLEGEGFLPLTKEEMAGLPKPAEGQVIYKNRLGELKFGPAPPASPAESGAQVLQKKMAEHFVSHVEAGATAADDLQMLSQMRALAAKVNTGPEAIAKQFAGRLGIKTEGVSNIEALNSIISRLVPQQRVPGSGTASDFDAHLFQGSLPQLMNTPAGNNMIMDTMEGVAKNKLARAEVGGKVVSGELSIPDGTKELLKLQAQARGMSDQVKAFVEATGGAISAPPPAEAIKELRASPTKARQFDEVFGPGASKRYLGQ